MAACVVLMALPAGAQTKGSDVGLNSYDAQIAWMLDQENQNQIEMAKLAGARASSAGVKSLADGLLQDHQSAENRLQAFAQGRGIDLAALGRQAASMSQDELELERRARTIGSGTGEWASTSGRATRPLRDVGPMMDKLARLNGAEFDREFVGLIMSEHRDLVGRLTEAQKRTRDADLKSIVDDLVPTCKQHLETAQQLQTRVSKGG